MGWTKVPEFVQTPQQVDHPFIYGCEEPTGRLNLQLPTDPWLCRKFEGVNNVVASGYPSKSSTPVGLPRDTFLRTQAQLKWYDLFASNMDCSTAKVSYCHHMSAMINLT